MTRRNPWDAFRYRFGDYGYSGSLRSDGRWTWEVAHPRLGLVAEGVAGTRAAAVRAAGGAIEDANKRNPLENNPAFSAYFVGRGGTVTERYFHGTGLSNAKRQVRAYAAAHGLKPSTVWQLRSTTRTGRRFAGEWARPLVKEADMAKWLSNPKHRSHRRRHRHNDPARYHHRHRYHNPHRRHRHNPVDVTEALRHPLPYMTQAAFGLGGAYGVIVLGNFVGNSFLPTYYQDITIMGKIARAAVRGLVAWGGSFAIKGMDAANRAALQVGAAVGIVGSLVLDVLGTTLAIGAGDQAQTLPTSFSFTGLPAPATAGLSAYMPVPYARRGAMGAGAYIPGRVPALHGFDGIGNPSALMYHNMR